jgi:GT2 family glycosyltransferase
MFAATMESTVTSTTARDALAPDSSEPLVYVVVLNWNDWEEAQECIESLHGLEYPNFRVVIVDNGSEDGSEAKLADAFPEHPVLQSGSNLGYAGGNNVGIRHAIAAGADYVWVLNNDTRVDPTALSELMAGPCNGEEYGIVASQNTRAEGWNYRVGFTLGDDGERHEIECDGCADAVPYHDAELVQGASMLMSVKALNEVGLIDEDYFHYFEDRDIAERILRGGWKLGFACRARVVHSSGKAIFGGSPQGMYYRLRNDLLYQRKFYDESAFRVLLRQPGMIRNALSIRRALRLDFRYSIVGIRALVDGWRGRGGRRDFPPDYY